MVAGKRKSQSANELPEASGIVAELARQGILGILLALAIFWLWRKDIQISDAYQKRVDDNNRLATVIEATNAASRALESTSENRSKVIESIGEATKATADAIRATAASVDQVRITVDRNNDRLASLCEEIEELKRDLSGDSRGVKRVSRR